MFVVGTLAGSTGSTSAGVLPEARKRRYISNAEMLGLLSLCIALLGPVLSLALYTNIVCDNPSDIDKGTGVWCWLSRLEPFVRQALFCFLTFHVYLMWRSVCGRCSMGPEMSKRKHWKLHLAVFAVPFLLCLVWVVQSMVYTDDILLTFSEITYMTRSREESMLNRRKSIEHATFNSSRETFTCEPLFVSSTVEFLVIHLINIVMCLLTTVMVGNVLKTCLDLAQLKATSENVSNKRYRKILRWLYKSLGSTHRKLLFLCSACSALVILQLFCVFTLVPNITDSALAIQNWALCNLFTGVCAAADRSKIDTYINAFAGSCGLVRDFQAKSGGTCGEQPLLVGTQIAMVRV